MQRFFPIQEQISPVVPVQLVQEDMNNVNCCRDVTEILLKARKATFNQSSPIGPMIELIQILLDINILPKFGADWSIFADYKVCTKSNVTVK